MSASAVKITWVKVTKAKQYTIYRSLKSKTGFKRLKTVSANSFRDKNVKPGKTYYYYIIAAGDKEADSSRPSDMAKASTLKAPSVSLKSRLENQVKVSWKKIKGASGYQVFISTKKSSGFGKKATLKKAGKTSLDIEKLSKGKRYYIKARAYKSVNGKNVYGTYSKVRNIYIN